MLENQTALLSWITFTPLLAAFIVLLTPASKSNLARPLAIVSSIFSLFLCFILWQKFDPSQSQFQLIQKISWIKFIGAEYHLGVDGISLPLVLLTAIMTPLAYLGTWPHHAMEKERFFVANTLFLQTGIYGTFFALNGFLFYVFWEVVLIPMFFLIGIWGGQNRLYATIKFFLYTLVGSLLMLVALVWLALKSGTFLGSPSLAFSTLASIPTQFDGTSVWNAIFSEQGLLFLAFTLAFVIKVPMVPFHTWLPDAHVQAPTIGSVFLAAILLKMGTYGLMRISLPFFPHAAQFFAPLFMILGIIGVIYGALCAMTQTDFKRLVAYSSVSHMGYILVGLFSFNQLAQAGALYQMINHGVSAAGLFLIVGFLYERRHTRDLNDFGGLGKVTPLMAIAFLVVTLSSVALPGTNGFVGEFTILLGSFQVAPIVTLFCGLGVILGAVYALKAYQMVMLGPVTHEENKSLTDMDKKEIITMIALAILVFALGFFPKTFFGSSDATLNSYSQQFTKSH
jgi:NADH-quinone oxidoreductase subunit M